MYSSIYEWWYEYGGGYYIGCNPYFPGGGGSSGGGSGGGRSFNYMDYINAGINGVIQMLGNSGCESFVHHIVSNLPGINIINTMNNIFSFSVYRVRTRVSCTVTINS